MTNGQSMREDPEIRKGVLASIIASILVLIFIQPVLRLVWALVLGLGGKFLDKYIDSIYRSSAFGHRNHVDVMLLLFLFAASSGLFMGFTSVITHRIIDSRSVPRAPQETESDVDVGLDVGGDPDISCCITLGFDPVSC